MAGEPPFLTKPGVFDILAKSEQKLVNTSEETTEADVGPSTFATATFVDGGGLADGVSLDDPDFWLKLMPEAAAAEEERKAEAEKLKAKAEFGMQTGEAGQKTSVERSCFCF